MKLIDLVDGNFLSNISTQDKERLLQYIDGNILNNYLHNIFNNPGGIYPPEIELESILDELMFGESISQIQMIFNSYTVEQAEFLYDKYHNGGLEEEVLKHKTGEYFENVFGDDVNGEIY